MPLVFVDEKRLKEMSVEELRQLIADAHAAGKMEGRAEEVLRMQAKLEQATIQSYQLGHHEGYQKGYEAALIAHRHPGIAIAPDDTEGSNNADEIGYNR